MSRSTYKQLGLLTYFTTGEKETRAWTIKEGMTAPQAAGVIHTGAARRGEAVVHGLFTYPLLVPIETSVGPPKKHDCPSSQRISPPPTAPCRL